MFKSRTMFWMGVEKEKRQEFYNIENALRMQFGMWFGDDGFTSSFPKSKGETAKGLLEAQEYPGKSLREIKQIALLSRYKSLKTINTARFLISYKYHFLMDRSEKLLQTIITHFKDQSPDEFPKEPEFYMGVIVNALKRLKGTDRMLTEYMLLIPDGPLEVLDQIFTLMEREFEKGNVEFTAFYDEPKFLRDLPTLNNLLLIEYDLFAYAVYWSKSSGSRLTWSAIKGWHK